MMHHTLMTLIQAAWSLPTILTIGRVKVTAMILPKGDRPMRMTESRSRSCEERVIRVDRVPYGTLMAV